MRGEGLEDEKGSGDEEDEKKRVIVKDGKSGGLVIRDFVLLPQNALILTRKEGQDGFHTRDLGLGGTILVSNPQFSLPSPQLQILLPYLHLDCNFIIGYLFFLRHLFVVSKLSHHFLCDCIFSLNRHLANVFEC